MTLSIFLKNGCMPSNIHRLLKPIRVSSLISAKRIHTWLFLFGLIIVSFAGFGQATKVVITTQPVPGYGNGMLMPVQPVVEIRDASNQKVTTSTAQVEIVIASGSGGTLGGTTKINAVNGVATFTNLTFSGVYNQSYVFQFKSNPVIAFDPFAYAGGTLTGNNGGIGWAGAWYDANPAFTDLVVNTTGFTYTNFTTSGGRASYTSSTGGDGGRLLPAVSNTVSNVLWLAFLANYDVQGGGFNNLRLYLAGALGGGIGGNAGINNWSILDNSLSAGASTSIPLNAVLHLALMKIDYTAATSSLWIDPTVSSFDGTQTPSISVSFAPVFDRIELYNRTTGIGTDEITLASTYKAALHLEQNLTPDVSIGATLPVKWNYFTATCNGAHTLLKWGTTNENSNNHFIVEKSIDALVWSVIGKVQGIGNSGVDQDYQFNDSAFASKIYYRLRQVDFNGNEDLSKTVATNCGTAVDRMLRVFPNPVSNILQITGARAGAGYELFDARGLRVRTGIVLSGTTTISLSGVPGGNYFLRVEGYNSRSVHVLKAGR